MDTLISPARYTLTEPQLAAAMALAGIAQGASSSLPAVTAPADPAGVLRGTPYLEGSTVAPALREALTVLASTRRVTSVAANVAGTPLWVTSLISRGAADGPYVAHPGDGDYDLAVLPTRMDAMLYADELLSITQGYSQDGEPAVTLGLAGIAAFAALADALQRAKLQAMLDRQPEYPATWSVSELESQLADGVAFEDTRWAVTAIRHTAPVALADAAGHLPDGLAELARAGLAAATSGGWALTPEGHSRALSFGQLVNVGTISAVEAAGGGITSSTASVFRTVLGVWLITWSVVDAKVEAVIEEVTAGRALDLVSSILG